ncbi:hypothetical protein DAEQUDRAFT_672986 [Daedalea quercina L-15889]|uniref:BTB domain-containing protein n=1 Tax=Daedalea quercina L-15889 TaxID=1314783 RepID=A0A165P0H9_9APHY|nr:hypothetical protein DAEQUDRAFT_672986 [Daedalea quercina L-15889]
MRPSEDSAAFSRDGELWFSDGNVVLETHGHAFKVHQGLLAYNSEVFRDLFTIPQPASSETFDGCPVVHLTDHPVELRLLLQAIFSGQSYHRNDKRVGFAIVAAIVRLSHKYQIDYVRDAYLWRMKSCFPTKFETWDTMRGSCGSTLTGFCTADAITAVNIARLTGTDSMLPTALYSCCLLDPECLLKGTARLDGTREYLS